MCYGLPRDSNKYYTLPSYSMSPGPRMFEFTIPCALVDYDSISRMSFCFYTSNSFISFFTVCLYYSAIWAVFCLEALLVFSRLSQSSLASAPERKLAFFLEYISSMALLHYGDKLFSMHFEAISFRELYMVSINSFYYVAVLVSIVLIF